MAPLRLSYKDLSKLSYVASSKLSYMALLRLNYKSLSKLSSSAPDLSNATLSSSSPREGEISFNADLLRI